MSHIDDRLSTSRLGAGPPASSAGSLGPTERIDSPERVHLSLELAGPMSRAFAYSIDYSLILLIIMGLVLISVSGLQQIIEWAAHAAWIQDLFDGVADWITEDESDPESTLMRGLALVIGIWLILELVLTSLYFLFFETFFAGRSPGKRWTGLRVVSEGGSALTWQASLLRNLLRAVDFLPAGYLVGVFAMIVSPRVQRLGDVVAGTLVIRERDPDPAALAAPEAVDPDLAAGFRFTRDELMAIGALERRLIRQTLLRAEGLTKRAAKPLLHRAATAIRARIGRRDPLPGALERDFLAALLNASERLG